MEDVLTENLQIVEGDKKLLLVNQRLDYQLRGDELKHVCLYEYSMEYYKDKLPKKELTPHTKFKDEHPQSKTHCLKHRKNRFSFVTPNIIGPNFPSRANDSESFCQMFLTLFKRGLVLWT